MTARQGSRWRAAVLLAAVIALLAVPGRATAQEPWEITRYEVLIEITDDATMLVVENIDLDFGSLERRGIFRYLPVREALPSPLPDDLLDVIPEGRDAGDFERALDVDAIEVASASGAPTDVKRTREGNDLMIRIGDPDVTITGRQQYTIRYRVRGALEPLPDIDALAWDAIGTGWPVPIRQATVEVRAPGVAVARCFQGPVYATDPCQASATPAGASFANASPLSAYEGLTIALEFDPTAIDVPQIMVDERPTVRRALVGSPVSIPLATGTAVVGSVGLIGLGWRAGRDRLARGGVTVDGHVDSAQAAVRRRGLFEPRAVPVEYRPPDDLRPGQLGLIIDERIDPVDISATIVDLAVRGHLSIEEIEGKWWFSKDDWRLTEGTAPADETKRFEQVLLDGLFDGRNEVTMSELKGTFASDYQKAETALYADGQSRRWFADRPDKTRGRWLAGGIVLLVAGLVGTVLLGMWLRVGVVGFAVALLGLGLIMFHRRMPRRTARGSAMLTRTLGFREFITTADADRMAFAEAEALFVEYLPYAVVFGAVDRWAGVFEDLGIDLGTAVGGFYHSPGPFYLAGFSRGMSGFSSNIGQALATVPASSGGGGFSGGGGGFSGGGMGGGGGGSW